MTELYFRKVYPPESTGGPPQYRLWKMVTESTSENLWLKDFAAWIGETMSVIEMGELARKAGRVTVEW